jgi:quercetin dioxygenase-like cupin family protein
MQLDLANRCINPQFFVVLEGELAFTLDQARRVLSVGESMTIVPDVVHQLGSINKNPVRVLYFNFPAVNPEDMWIIESYS